jgi:hypothetical protein
VKWIRFYTAGSLPSGRANFARQEMRGNLALQVAGLWRTDTFTSEKLSCFEIPAEGMIWHEGRPKRNGKGIRIIRRKQMDTV